MHPTAPPMKPWHADADTTLQADAAIRRRLVDGTWREDAAMRLGEFFSAETRSLLPSPDLSQNPFKQIVDQIACLYDVVPTASADGQPDTSRLITWDMWPIRQDCHRYQTACNECLLRIDIEEDGTLGYRVVPVDTVVMRTYGRSVKRAPFNPGRSQPAAVHEARCRIGDGGKEVWTWEVWDVSDPANPIFQILAMEEANTADGKTETIWTDQTALYSGGEGWPDAYRAADGTPVLPYVLYHRRVGDHLRDGMGGAEAVSGTLTTSALWTFWLGGVRDGAHPQRYVMDALIPSTNTSPGPKAIEEVRLNPQTLLQIHGLRRPDGTYSSPSAGQFQPACDPKTMGEAIESYSNAIAVNAGLSPADVQRGSSGQSGYAIVVSQKGRRDAQRKMIPACRFGDQLLLAKGAALLRDPALPTTPQAWSIVYAVVGVSPEEQKAEQEVVDADLKMRVISRREAIRRRNPQLSDEQINALIDEIEGEQEDTTGNSGKEAEAEGVDDEAVTAHLADAMAALTDGDTAAAQASIMAALKLHGEDMVEDDAEDAGGTALGSDNA
jgi:hypothetical protein